MMDGERGELVRVVHARWILHGEVEDWDKTCECSACACEWDADLANNAFNYCPNCGAKMDGGNE